MICLQDKNYSPNLLSRLIPEVCEALYQMLHTSHLKLPQTEDEWRRVQADYNNEWQFPNCMGALDGKRVLIGKPAKSGSIYYDYKSNFSVIMLALVDARYKFLYVDVGGAGRASDGATLSCKGSLVKGLSSILDTDTSYQTTTQNPDMP
ncbi:hypothetical protein Pcinc_012537 [Petrolisthes cinctipes]|uniref:DDE Tnp4 domain-containing protein n=1 Tax=Petrolisthes cinctipes TaxID=88211 RepID=A0AAE1FYT0_PETCI|nr:hypothetical protein Pcinc_012537 [Petrolisthes cinctipes]